ncbi:MAG: hypothetical protein ACOCUW_04910 [Gemmatimonadota bacterium]
MDPRDHLVGVLRQLRELGLAELYLDELTAEEAEALLAGRAEGVRPDARSRPNRGSGPGSATTS